VFLLARAAAARDERTGRRYASSSDYLVSSDQRTAIERGTAWIATSGRQASSGSWGDESETRVADTALSVLALMAAGNTVVAGKTIRTGSENSRAIGPPQGRGRYGAQVYRGINYLAREAWQDQRGRVPGYIRDDDKSRMHGHGFATLALAQAVGNLGARGITAIRKSLASGKDAAQLSFGDQVRWGLERAVKLIERAQDRDTGGWYYEPTTPGHEGSMTVTQIAALRAAQSAGVLVSGHVLKRAYEYVRSSQNRAGGERHGGFAYQKNNKMRVSYALTAAALTTLFDLGRYGRKKEDAETIELGLKFMDRTFLDTLSESRQQWFYYAMFYGAQALYLSQDQRRLRRDWPRIRQKVLSLQRADGSFRKFGADARSDEYCTAMACLILQVTTETLPILQRR
jgi:hypothetical protein